MGVFAPGTALEQREKSRQRRADLQRGRVAKKRAEAEAAAKADEIEDGAIEVPEPAASRVDPEIDVDDEKPAQLRLRIDGPTLDAFLDDYNFVTVVMGPWGCLSAETEVLTPDGWVAISEWRGQEIAEWHSETSEIAYRVPAHYIDEPCAEMWHFRNEHSLSMILSDEHRVAVFDWAGRFMTKPASHLAQFPSKHRIPVSFSAPYGDADFDSIRLAVAIAADGHLPKAGNQVTFGLRKERKKARLRELLHAVGIEWREREQTARPTETVFTFARDGLTKGLGPEWYRASRQALEILLDEVMLWDGSLSKGEHRFATTLIGEAEVVQFAAHATGRRATISSPDKTGTYCVQITTPDSRKASVSLRGDHTFIERVPAPGGRKYCFTTSTGFFIARHNGRIFITGNSGKTTTCICKMYDIAHRQRVGRGGVRKTRWAVVRNTYSELRDTTIRSWLDWFPESVYGPMVKQRPYTHTIRVPGAPDDRGRPTTVEMEVIFVALDDENDRKKLLSLELTGAWVNEAREIIKGIIDDIVGRTGRYPSKRDGGHSWSGLIMDTNAPAETHWLPIMMGLSAAPEDMSEEMRDALRAPENWSFYIQPGALLPVRDDRGKVVDFRPNPVAENIRNLTDGFEYYMQRKSGKPRSWVMVNFCNELGQIVAGKPVWPGFDKDKHVAKRPIAYDANYPLLVGVDSTGRNPAAVFAQYIARRWRVLAELIGRDVTSEKFAPQLKAKVAQIVATAGQNYEQATVQFYRDPHEQKSETDDRTTTQVYRKYKINLIPAPGGNGVSMRVTAVETLFDHDHIEIAAGCTLLIAGCGGGYRYRKLQIAGIDAYDELPDKRNGYADVCDALQYVALGGGAGRALVSAKGSKPKPVQVATRYRPGEHREDLWKRRKVSA